MVAKFKRRVHGWAWNTFAVGMSISAVCLTLAGLEHQPAWLRAIEFGLFGLNCLSFVINTSMMALQAAMFPAQAKRIILDGSKSVFVPLMALSFATILIGAASLDVVGEDHWISPNTIVVLFWFYLVFAILISFSMLFVWFQVGHDMSHFTPATFFLAFPIMLCGVCGFSVLQTSDVDSSHALPILLASYLCQGAGTGITFLLIAVYLQRIISTGFLSGHAANGAFVVCGPPGFTALALIKLGEQSMRILPAHGVLSKEAAEAWYGVSVLVGVMLLGLAIFLCALAALPYIFRVHWTLTDALSGCALTFPNVGHINGLRTLAKILDSKALGYVHLCEVLILATVWLALASILTIAFFKGRILLSSEEVVLRDIIGVEQEEQPARSQGQWTQLSIEDSRPASPLNSGQLQEKLH